MKDRPTYPRTEERIKQMRSPLPESPAVTIRVNRRNGFSLVELLTVVLIVGILLTIAIPAIQSALRSYSGQADARNLASQVSLARMRSTSDSSHARLNCNLGGNSCQLEICNKTVDVTCQATAAFSAEGAPVQLSPNVSFGFGAVAAAPPGTQSTIQNISPIAFNSRGIPVDTSNAATGNDALYITDSDGRTFGITVFASGRIAVWQYSGGNWIVR